MQNTVIQWTTESLNAIRYTAEHDAACETGTLDLKGL